MWIQDLAHGNFDSIQINLSRLQTPQEVKARRQIDPKNSFKSLKSCFDRLVERTFSVDAVNNMNGRGHVRQSMAGCSGACSFALVCQRGANAL